MATAHPNRARKSLRKKIAKSLPGIITGIVVVAVIVLCSWGATVDTTVNQHTYLKSFGLDEKSRYVLVEYSDAQRPKSSTPPATTESPAVTHWLQDAGDGKVRFAIVVSGKREVVEYPLSRITWAAKPGAPATALLSLTKGEDLKVDALWANPWAKDPREFYPSSKEQENPDPNKLRKLLLWNERVDYYESVNGHPDAVNTLLNKDAYRITITADRQTLDRIKGEAGVA